MKRISYCLFSIISILVFWGCHEMDEDMKWYHYESDSYVTRYLSFDEIQLVQHPAYPHTSALLIEAVMNKQGYSCFSTDEDEQLKYEAKCDLYNDHGGSFKWTTNQEFGCRNTQADRDFVSIDIVSENDWDESHPAGTSLNDVFRFASSSPYKYIASGYKKSYFWMNEELPEYVHKYYAGVAYDRAYDEKSMHLVHGLVSELSSDDLILLGDCIEGMPKYVRLGALFPVNKPTGSKTHNLTLTMVDTEGNVLTATAKINFTTWEIY